MDASSLAQVFCPPRPLLFEDLVGLQCARPYGKSTDMMSRMPTAGAAAESVFICPSACTNEADCSAAAFGCKSPGSRRFKNLFGSFSPAGYYFRYLFAHLSCTLFCVRINHACRVAADSLWSAQQLCEPVSDEEGQDGSLHLRVLENIHGGDARRRTLHC